MSDLNKDNISGLIVFSFQYLVLPNIAQQVHIRQEKTAQCTSLASD